MMNIHPKNCNLLSSSDGLDHKSQRREGMQVVMLSCLLVKARPERDLREKDSVRKPRQCERDRGRIVWRESERVTANH